MKIRAVIFDLGGVILDSPMAILAAFEQEKGLPPNFLNRLIVNSGAEGAWARLERGELPMEEFVSEFDEEIRNAGVDISSREMMNSINEYLRIRPSMIEAVHRLRKAGYKVAALTNNWVIDEEVTDMMHEFRNEFDEFIESSKEGMAKPDPRIYQIALERLGVEPGEAVFLDDIGRNLKPARKIGMHTIKVESVEKALSELEELLGLPLAGASDL